MAVDRPPSSGKWRAEKLEVRVFLPRPVVDIIDGMIGEGLYSSRSEAVRSIVHTHLQDCMGLLKPGKKEQERIIPIEGRKYGTQTRKRLQS